MTTLTFEPLNSNISTGDLNLKSADSADFGCVRRKFRGETHICVYSAKKELFYARMWRCDGERQLKTTNVKW